MALIKSQLYKTKTGKVTKKQPSKAFSKKLRKSINDIQLTFSDAKDKISTLDIFIHCGLNWNVPYQQLAKSLGNTQDILYETDAAANTWKTYKDLFSQFERRNGGNILYVADSTTNTWSMCNILPLKTKSGEETKRKVET